MKAPFVTAHAYMLINIKTGHVMYIVGGSATDVWRESCATLGWHAHTARSQGWRAKRVLIQEVGP